MSRGSIHKIAVTLKEWEYLSNVAARHLQTTESKRQREVYTKLREKFTHLGEEVSRGVYVLSLSRVEVKELLNRARAELATLTDNVIPAYEASNRPLREQYVIRSRQHIEFLNSLTQKMEARL